MPASSSCTRGSVTKGDGRLECWFVMSLMVKFFQILKGIRAKNSTVGLLRVPADSMQACWELIVVHLEVVEFNDKRKRN